MTRTVEKLAMTPRTCTSSNRNSARSTTHLRESESYLWIKIHFTRICSFGTMHEVGVMEMGCDFV